MKSENYGFDWGKLRSASNALILPDAIDVLCISNNIHELERAYWRIDNEAVVQGTVYGSSCAVIYCLVSALGCCQPNARVFILELIVQIVSGSPAASELLAGNYDISKKICQMVLQHKIAFFDILKKGTREEVVHCIDILGVCSNYDVELKNKLLALLKGMISKGDLVDDFKINWIKELEAV